MLTVQNRIDICRMIQDQIVPVAKHKHMPDITALADTSEADELLLWPILRADARVAPLLAHEDARRLAADELARLPRHLRALETELDCPIGDAAELQELAAAQGRDSPRPEYVHKGAHAHET